MKKRVITIIILIMLFAICTCSFAQDMSGLQDRRDELKNQISESNEQINQIELQITENLEQLNKLDEKISNYENDIYILQKDLNKIEKEVNIIEERLNIIQKNYNSQKNAFKSRIVALYENGDILYLDVLLSSDSVSDFISNYFLIGEIARYDNNLLKDLENQKTQIEEIKKTLEERKEKVKTEKNSKEKITTALENARIIRNSYIEKLTEEEKETQNKIAIYKNELNDIERRIIAIATGEGIEDYVGGEFLWPVPGYYTITSRFGPRIHPILKIPRAHSGTDIACPTGTNILAANDGIVISATYSKTGYGNMVMIDHGGGIVSLYGHGSELIVEVRTNSKKR